MKKVILALAVVFSVALVSCGSKEAAATDTVDTTVATEEVADTTVAEEAATDSNAVDTNKAAEEAPAAEEAAK